MPYYEIDTSFKFEGVFKVNADSLEEAEDIVRRDCGLVLGGNIHTSHPDVDWDFPCHPEKEILNSFDLQ